MVKVIEWGSPEHNALIEQLEKFDTACHLIGNALRKGKGDMLIIKADGNVSKNTNKDFCFFQKVVDGDVEIVKCPIFPDYVMAVNEDGRKRELPLNKFASHLACGSIVGDVVLMPKGTLK